MRWLIEKWGLTICFVAVSLPAFATTEFVPPLNDVTKLLPNQIGNFQAEGPTKPYVGLVFGTAKFEDYSPVSAGQRIYKVTNTSGVTQRFTVYVVRTGSDSAAYALETAHLNWLLMADSGEREELRANPPLAIQTNAIGTASIVANTMFFGGVSFVKGSTYVNVTGAGKETPDLKTMEALAKLLAEPIDPGEGEIPVLVKHLPDWERVKTQALYATSLGSLKEAAKSHPVFDALDFIGGTEAVIASYGQSQLVIVEFTTPQFSIDNDSRIWTKIAELKSQGQPVPSAYRRVGNYSVFVFNAPDEKSANELVNQVKYEKVVQWLGDDPHLYERLQKYFAETSAGVLMAVLQGSGLSLLLCLAAGGLIGTMLFRHRRAQKASMYSDAGGGVRLNLDELTGPVSSQRLLTSGKRSDRESP